MIGSFREYLERLEQDGEIAHVTREVEREWEIPAVTRKVLQMPSARRPALIFDRVKGFQMPLCVGLYTNRRRYAKALDVKEEQILARWDAAFTHPIPPERVTEAPCQEVVLTGEQASLDRLPLPVWTPGRDAAPYVTAPCVIVRDPETGFVNLGTYRMMYKSPRTTGLFVNPLQHVGMVFAKFREKGAMDVAVALGPEPVCSFAAVSKVPYGMSELEVAGGLKGGPIQLVRGKTVDLDVPATAEIVLEGEIHPGETEREGPFGEFLGYMSTTYDMPVFHLKAITHRRDPIYHCFVSQKPPSESSMLRSIGNACLAMRELKAMGVPGVVDVHITEAGCAWYHFVVAIRKIHPAHPKMVMNAIWATKAQLAKQVIVVDDDVDVYNPFEVEWAVATRVQPQRDVIILPDYVGQLEDLSQPEGERHMASKMGIDATRKFPYPALAYPDRPWLAEVERRWESYGVRELDF
ncbi:MAG: UbiD family decarboxylase [Deltaproteobacteria bacterium]|nr:UbiD family decarboxylase [Deltaproteobacteria bacterium]